MQPTLNDIQLYNSESLEFLRKTVIKNPYIPHKPTPKQMQFLALTVREALFGGACGGGKSDSLLMAALQFVDVPGYAALVLRQTFADLNKPGGLMKRAFSWLMETDAEWNAANKTWNFPSGATITFGYLQDPNDIYQYQSSEFQAICWDELTQFREMEYRYLFSRLRKLKGMPVPPRVRAGSNPGGKGHGWVKRRFFDTAQPGRMFVPSKLEDNPFLDREEYELALAELDPVTRRQLRNGDWEVQPEGNMFKRAWFKIIDHEPPGVRWYRYWDLAATEQKTQSDDPDWTSGAKVGIRDGQWYIAHVNRFRENPKPTEDRIKQQAAIDGRGTAIRMEQEPGASGKTVIDYYARNVLAGYDFNGQPSVKDKVSRAGPLSAAAERGNVFLVRGAWNDAFLDEIGAFPTDGVKDDQVDSVTGGMIAIGIPNGAFPDAQGWRVGENNSRMFVPDRIPLEQIGGRLGWG